jgi:murein DD-endopeptidase MepM/ murein hydrolase activator NlpD
MAAKKYKYNPQTLSYDEVNLSVGARILKFVLYLSPSIVMGLIFAFFFTKQIDSPKEALLKNEIELYKSEFERLKADLDLANSVLDDIEKRDEDLYRVALYADKFPEELRLMGVGGSEKYAYLKGFSNSELIKSTSETMDLLERRLNSQRLSFKELLDLAKNKEKMLASIPAIQPVRNNDLKHMASGFGYRIDPIYKTRRMHTGMDFTANIGTEVYSTGDGVVESLEKSGWGYGQCI